MVVDEGIQILAHGLLLHPVKLHRHGQAELGQQILVGAVRILPQKIPGGFGIVGGKGRAHHDHIVSVPGNTGLLLQPAAVELGQSAAQIRRHGQQHDVVPLRHLPLFAVLIGGIGGILGHLLQAVPQLAVIAVHVGGGPELEGGDRLQIPLRLLDLDAQLVGIAAHGQQLGGLALAVLPYLGIDMGAQSRVVGLQGEVRPPVADHVVLLHKGQSALAAVPAHGVGQEADGHSGADDHSRQNHPKSGLFVP